MLHVYFGVDEYILSDASSSIGGVSMQQSSVADLSIVSTDMIASHFGRFFLSTIGLGKRKFPNEHAASKVGTHAPSDLYMDETSAAELSNSDKRASFLLSEQSSKYLSHTIHG
jgi:hypothetical protein